ncbi:RimK/LysX family protein [Candidatus Woesearchaeota archaeon]|nr:RimK/LysX family protein [Candidatus Woesearchaeota archaeon]
MTKRTKEEQKIIIGPVENITINAKEKKGKYEGRVDTGAASSSIDARIVADLKLGPVLSVKTVRNAHGETLRPVVEAEIVLKKKKMTTIFTVADRSRMKYKVLIGRNILKQGFLIDVTK